MNLSYLSDSYFSSYALLQFLIHMIINIGIKKAIGIHPAIIIAFPRSVDFFHSTSFIFKKAVYTASFLIYPLEYVMEYGFKNLCIKRLYLILLKHLIHKTT